MSESLNGSIETPKTDVVYFGLGTNIDPEMMTAIIGRTPEGSPAVLHNHQLVIQQPHHLPEEAKETMQDSWTDDEIANFHSYAARPAEGHEIVGVAWKITAEEREMISNWEFWYKREEVTIHELGSTATEGMVAATDMLHADQDAVPAHEIYPDTPTYIMPKERMMEVARSEREKFIARQENN